MSRTVSPSGHTRLFLSLLAAVTLVACSGGGGGSTSTPTSPTTTTPSTPPPTSGGSPSTIAFVQDVSPILQADCARCHSGSRPDGNFSVTSYASVMRAVVAGSANSLLIRETRQGGGMYSNWSGNAAAKAETVRAWVVDHRALESR